MLRRLIACVLACSLSLPVLAATPHGEILVKYLDGRQFAANSAQHLGHGRHLLRVPQQRGQPPAEQRAALAQQLATLRSDPGEA